MTGYYSLSLSDADLDAAHRALHDASLERLDPADLADVIAAEERHRSLMVARLSDETLSANERTALVGGVAFSEAKLIELGKLAARHRRAMKIPGYPQVRPASDLGPRFDAARYVDLVDLIQTLTGQTAVRRGDRYAIACPWHEDRHPSLTIYAPGRGWWCFVCQIGGSPLDFVMRIQHMNAVEALLWIEEITNTYPESWGGEARQ